MSRRITAGEEALHARALSRVIRAETWRRERIVNHFRFALFTLIGLAEWAERGSVPHPHLTAMPFVFIAWGLVVELINLTWLRKHFRTWVPAAITTMDIIVITIAVRIIFGHAVRYGEDALREIDRAMSGLIIIVSANMIRFSWRTSVWSGLCALASLGYLRVYSDTMGKTANVTDILVFAGVVVLLVYANLSFRTITERLLFDLRRAQQQRLSSLRGLVAGVSHEVNSPLGVVSGNVQLAARAAQILSQRGTTDNQDERRALESLRESSEANLEAIKRISSIVRALRDFASIDDSETGRVDLRSNLDTCIELLSTETRHRIHFERRYPEPLETTCRPAQLNQAFAHIIRNAVQSIDGDGTVTITGVHDADGIRIEIADTGRGIPKKVLAGIFDLRFGRKGDRVGMGLGLPISHGIIHDHGGTIEATSTVGQGTTVTIRLPAD